MKKSMLALLLLAFTADFLVQSPARVFRRTCCSKDRTRGTAFFECGGTEEQPSRS